MSEDKFFKELQEKREANLEKIKIDLTEAFDLQNIESITAVQHGNNAGRTINLKSRILSKICGEKITRNNIKNSLYDFDNFGLLIDNGFIILKLNKKAKAGRF